MAIYRPAKLTSKEPLLVWGEGGVREEIGLTFPEYISEIASYGYVVLADGPPVENTGGRGGAKGPGGPGAAKGGPGAAKGKGPGGNGTMVNGAALTASIDWMEREVKDSKSRFYKKVDTAHVAAMGMSCGGLMSYGASADPRITTVGIWNSGLFEKDPKILNGIHSSVIIITGGDTDIAHDNGKSDFSDAAACADFLWSLSFGGTWGHVQPGQRWSVRSGRGRVAELATEGR